MDTTYPADTPKLNTARILKGIRPVDNTWFFYGRRNGSEDWKLKESDLYLAKRMQRGESGSPIWEEDYFYSDSTFVTIDGENWERLVVHYDYSSCSFQVHYIGTNPVHKNAVEPFENSFSDFMQAAKIVDSILESWGHRRMPKSQ